jgi:hypothetical protein
MATLLDRAASTVSREIAHHGGRPEYRAKEAPAAARPGSGLNAVRRENPTEQNLLLPKIADCCAIRPRHTTDNGKPIRRKRLAFDFSRREDDCAGSMFQSGQLVRVNLAGLQAEGVMFQAAVTDAVGHIVKQTSEQPPMYLVKLLFSFRGVSEVEVPADRIHDK